MMWTLIAPGGTVFQADPENVTLTQDFREEETESGTIVKIPTQLRIEAKLETPPKEEPKPEYKPILCLDFDGVIHSYTSGWKGIDVIPDPPVPGAVEFITEAVNHFEVAVYSTRSNELLGMAAMREWLSGYLSPEVFEQIRWPNRKPSAFVTLDDRAVTFDGQWPAVEDLLKFKPWNKGGGQKAKPLDWAEHPSQPLLQRAVTLLGTYTVSAVVNPTWTFRSHQFPTADREGGAYNLDDAKERCQADYERRVRQLLTEG